MAAPLVIGGFKATGQIPKWVSSVNEQRIAKIDHNENYKSTFVEGTASKLVEGTKTVGEVLKLTTLPLRPTTFLRKKAKENELLQSLLKIIRYDAMEGFVAPALGKQRLLAKDYDTQLREFWGGKNEKLTKIFQKHKLYTSQNRFTSKDRKNWLMNSGLSDDVNDNLAYVIRSGKNFKKVDDQIVEIDANIVRAGKEIRKELDSIYNAAVKAGLKPNRAINYFPRGWRIDIIRANPDEFIEKIMTSEGATKEAATELWKKLATEGTPESSTASGLSSRLQSERLLNNLDDAEFGKFLNNDVEGVLRQYYAESAALITRTKLLGENTEDFVNRWINPIKESGLNLSKREELYLKTLYEVVTGQKGRINRNRRDLWDLVPTGKIGAGIHDTLTVTMQTSMLGLATLTSFAEIGVPLLLGTQTKIGGKSMAKAVADQGKEWWSKQKQNFGVGDPNVDIRPANRQDLNAFMTSVNLAAEDRAVAIYGQAVGKTATKIQNFFFKTIGLHDWTRFVQLVGYDMGKNLVYKNLRTIADNPNMNKANKARIQDELAELGVDVQKGLDWLNRGGLHTDRFYLQEVRAAANRYTNEVVMNPTAASAQKPLVHSLATTKWIYGLMGFPTAFSNGPLRRTVRNLTKDAKTISSGGTRISSARAVTGAVFMANVGLLNYTLRTGGQNFKDLESGKITEQDLIERSLQYAGLLGPVEYYLRFKLAARYESKILAAMGSVTGPNLTDMIDYLGAFVERGVLAETALKRAPFVVTLKSTHRETYDKLLKAARELDKEYLVGSVVVPEGSKKREGEVTKSGKKFFATGGLIKGEGEVLNAKEKPEERINPFTGEPYTALYYNGGAVRKQYNDGGSEGKKKGNIVKRALDEIKVVDALKNSKYFAKLPIEDQERILKAYEGKTIVNTTYVDSNLNSIKTSPEVFEKLLQAQKILENREDANLIQKNRKSTRGKGWENISEWLAPRNPNNYKIPIVIGSAYTSPDEKAKKHEDYLQQMKEYEQGLRAEKPPKQAGLKSFHITGDAIDLNQNFYDALGERKEGVGGLIGGGRTPDLKAVFSALESVGFKQHPNEWWHWSIGEFDH